MHKLIIKLKYKSLFNLRSKTIRKKFVFKFEDKIFGNIGFYNFEAYENNNNNVLIKLLLENNEIKTFDMAFKSFYIFTPQLTDISTEYIFLLK